MVANRHVLCLVVFVGKAFQAQLQIQELAGLLPM